jgi:hypothetical protein
LQAFFNDHVFRHPSFERGTLAVQMLIGLWSHVDRNLTFLAARENAVTIVRDYECLGAGSTLAHYLVPTLFRHSRMELADAAHIALHVLRETKNFVDTCGGASEILVLRKDGTFGLANRIDLMSGEEISAVYRGAMSRLFVASSDLKMTEAKLREEFEMAFTIIQSARKRIITDHETSKVLADALSKIVDHAMETKIIKS